MPFNSRTWRREPIEAPRIRQQGSRHETRVYCLGSQIAEIHRKVYRISGGGGITTYRVIATNARGRILYGALSNRFFRTKEEMVAEINQIPYPYERAHNRYGIAINCLPIGRLEPIRLAGIPQSNRKWLFRVEPGIYQVEFEWLDGLSFRSIDEFLKALIFDLSNFETRARVLHAHLRE